MEKQAMKRGIIAVIAGLFAGVLAYYMMDLLGGGMYVELTSMPMIEDAGNPSEFYQNAPPGFWVWTVMAYLSAGLMGGVISSLFHRSDKLIISIITGALLLVLAIFNLSQHFHPAWVWAIALVQFIPMSILGSTLIKSSLKEINVQD